MNNKELVDIPILVSYDNHPLLLEANPGVAPHKICVPIGTPWPFERIEIKVTYPQFTKYVGSRESYKEVESQTDYSDSYTYWSNPVSGKYYIGDGQITGTKYSSELPAYATSDSDIDDSYMSEISGLTDYHNTIDAGQGTGYNGQEVLVRRRH